MHALCLLSCPACFQAVLACDQATRTVFDARRTLTAVNAPATRTETATTVAHPLRALAHAPIVMVSVTKWPRSIDGCALLTTAAQVVLHAVLSPACLLVVIMACGLWASPWSRVDGAWWPYSSITRWWVCVVAGCCCGCCLQGTRLQDTTGLVDDCFVPSRRCRNEVVQRMSTVLPQVLAGAVNAPCNSPCAIITV
jgi:hypothetical protein